MNEDALPQQSFLVAVGQAKVIGFALETAPGESVSGWTLAFYLRSARGTLLVTKTSSDGITVTGATAGTWDVTLSADDTAVLAPGLPAWSLWRTDDGSETPLAVGTCEVFRTAKTGSP